MASIFSPRRKVYPLWSFQADGVIWRLVPTPEGYFVGEDRNKEEKSVVFFCIHEESGHVLWSKLKFDERWWIGIEAVYKRILFIHEFATPDLPDHKKIHAVDLMTGRVLWTNEDAKFLFAADESVYTARETFDKRIFSELDLQTGAMRGEVEAASVHVLRDMVTDPSQLVEFPVVVDPAAHHEASGHGALGEALPDGHRIVHIEALEKNDALVIGYYEDVSPTKEQVALNQHLIIVDKSTGRTMHKDILNKGTNMAVPDTYFAKGDTIYYIKDKRVLHAVNIPVGQ